MLKSTDSGAKWTTTGALPVPGNVGFSIILVGPSTVTNDHARCREPWRALSLEGRRRDGPTPERNIQNVVFDPAVAGGLDVPRRRRHIPG